MPIDSPEATAAPTTRRTFLARAAVGSALVGVGVAGGPLGLFGGAAGAQEGPGADAPLDDAGELEAADFAALATPLELAAVQAYQQAVTGGALAGAWLERARQFQDHHQAVVDTLTPLIDEEAADPVPDDELLAQAGPALAGTDQAAALTALAAIEDTLVATHLYALSGLPEKSTAKLVGQVLAIEAQQSAALGVGAGTPIDQLTPVAVTTDGARTGSDTPTTTSTTTTVPVEGDETTTTEAGN